MKATTANNTSEREPLASDAQEANEAPERLESSSSGTDPDDGLQSEARHAAPQDTSTKSKIKNIPATLPKKRGIKEEEDSLGFAGYGVTAGVAALGVLAAACLLKWLRSKTRRKEKVKAFDYGVLLERLQLASSSTGPLAGTKVVFSPLMQVQGIQSQYVEGAGPTDGETVSRSAATSTTEALQALLSAGVTLVGRATSDELQLGLTAGEDAAPNPLNERVGVSGTGSGAAAVVAAGLADVAIGVDHIAGLRVQAAFNGLFCCRASQRSASLGNTVSVAGDLDSLAWACRDAATLLSVGRVLLPRESGSGDLMTLVVADELFLACEVFEMEVALRACIQGTREFASQNSNRAGLGGYLQQTIRAADYFLTAEERARQQGAMKGMRRAAEALLRSNFLQRHGQRSLETAGGLGVEGDWRTEVTEEDRAAAKEVQQQVVRAFREILKDNIMIIPTVAGHPLPNRLDSCTEEEKEQWKLYRVVTSALNCIAALGGFPQVVIPIPFPGCPPISVSLLGLSKTDLQLITIAGKLGPFIARAVPGITADLIEAHEAEKAAQAGAAGSQDGSENGRGPPEKNGKALPKVAPNGIAHSGKEAGNAKAAAREKAEAWKEQGNTAFKAGQYNTAIRHYTAALELQPGDPVYLSNRAMALLKVMQFQEAEADCTLALAAGPAVKPLLRRGVARKNLDKLAEAEKDFRHALSLEPNNRQAREELDTLRSLMELQNGAQTQGLANGIDAAAQEDHFL